ncbi:DgyrCDS7616 [Dimorphilus gyrociliatus]|uniref:DgyrCDS7616 n=1 Tax=Dimorphilus gyrociliatus TaxID=2664684 RepID=A0A7I8VRJ7_9ANNE|nr:DgyrCDS7616 [Dimorphilus gyrociliatus]
MSDKTAKDILQNLGRSINLLSDPSRFNRKKAFEEIRKETVDRKESLDSTVFDNVMSDIIRHVLKLFSDSVENLRENAISFTARTVERVSKPEEFMHLVIPVLLQRLGQQEIVEPSEELRLHLVKLIGKLLNITLTNLEIYVQDLIKILSRTVLDKFHEVKKESCKCCSKLATLSKERFFHEAENLVGPLMQCLGHQHSKVRLEAIKAIGQVLLNSSNKPVDRVIPNFAQRLFDPTPVVRLEITKLIPLLLTSIADEMPDIQETADGLWHDVGLKYANENEEELKDSLNFEVENLEHYPEGLSRPNIGCRRLVYLHFSKIAPGLAGDLGDWKTETKIKASQLLYILLINEEMNITQHIDKILPSLYRAITDEDEKVRNYTEKSATLLGYFAKAEVWSKLALNQLQLTSGNKSSLLILSSISKGCSCQVLSSLLPRIFQKLCLPEVCQSNDEDTQKALLSVLNSLIEVCQKSITDVEFDMFFVLITVSALSQSNKIKSETFRLIDMVSKAVGLNERESFISKHARKLLEALLPSSSSWAKYSADRFIVDTLLIECGAATLDEVSGSLLPILKNALRDERDPEIRARFLTLIGRSMLAAECGKGLSNCADELLSDSILPCFVWQAGRVAASVRTAAVSCVWAMVDKNHVRKIGKLFTPLMSLIEDDLKETRLIALRVLNCIFNSKKEDTEDLDEKIVHDSYHNIIKRLDDVSDEIRILTGVTIESYFKYFENREGYEVQLFSAHLEDIYKTLLVHLDDQNRQVQDAVAEALKVSGALKPTMLLELISEVRFKHRSMQYLDEVAESVRRMDMDDREDKKFEESSYQTKSTDSS